MEQSLLIDMIRTLSTTEKAHLMEYAMLSFVNNGRMKEHVLPFLRLCFEHPWHLPEQRLEKSAVYAQLFPGEKFVEGKIEKVMVDALKIVRGFLLSGHYFRDDNQFHQILDFSEVARARGLANRQVQLLTRVQKIQEETLCKNARFFYRQFLLEYAFHDIESFSNQIKGELNISNVLNALETHYQLNRLALMNRLILQQKTSKINLSNDIKTLIGEIYTTSHLFENIPNFKVQYEIFRLLNDEKPGSIEIRSLFKYIRENEQILGDENLKEIYSYLRNLCILALAADVQQLEIDLLLHDLFKDNLKRGYLHYEGKLHPSRYWAVSSNAIRVKNCDWAIEFIEKYKDELIGENETRDIYRMNLANYLFAIGRFEECLDNIPSTSPFLDYFLHGKRLELKALYELRSDLLSYKIDAYKMFLSRTSPKLLPEAKRKTHSDFVNFLNQLLHSIPGDKKRAERIEERIREKKQSAEWRWLLEKAIELGKS